MPDIPEIPETAPGATPDATLGAPTSRPEPSVADTARLLAEHFPALFGAGVIKPIKLRIQADIHQRAPGVFTKKALSIFLQRHTTGTAYLRALVAAGATRIDLDGQPVGEITAEHRDAAGVELERRRAIVEAKKHAGREAARASRHDARALRPPRPPQPGVQRGPGRPDDAGSGTPRRPHKPLPERRLARAHEQGPVNAPALPLTEVVDPTGAGDAFAAGLLYGLHEGWAVSDALEMAHATAAVSLRGLSTCAAVEDYRTCLARAREWGPRPSLALQQASL